MRGLCGAAAAEQGGGQARLLLWDGGRLRSRRPALRARAACAEEAMLRRSLLLRRSDASNASCYDLAHRECQAISNFRCVPH